MRDRALGYLDQRIERTWQRFMDRHNSYLLNFSYAFLILWCFICWSCHQVFIIFFLPVLIIFVGFPFGLILYSIVLFFRRDRWVSESTIAAFILLLPLVWLLFGQLLFS
ncbi:MAG: hypothetical protein ACE3L7_05705 [Candidatus Pristimantibacillus sp.]